LFLGGIRVVFFNCSHDSEEGEEACENQKGMHIGEEEATERGWRW